MPKRKRKRRIATEPRPKAPARRCARCGPERSRSGSSAFPVDLLSAVRPRQTAMKLVDKSGHALGREYHCSKEDKELDHDELVRGYETDDGKMVVITDEEFESVAPEMSGDIELRGFVPLEQIPPMYFQKPYFLAPSGQIRQGVQPARRHHGEDRSRRHRQLRHARPRVPRRNRLRQRRAARRHVALRG